MLKERRQESAEDMEPIEKEVKELEASVENWIQALGKGIKGLESKIIEAQNQIEFLQSELLRGEAMQKSHELSDDAIYAVINKQKNLLSSANEEDKKKVLQEYVDRIIIKPSKDINSFDVEINYRVFDELLGNKRCLFRINIFSGFHKSF